MRLIPKHRHHRQAKAPRISISHAEIAADLHYPAGRQPGTAGPTAQNRRGAR